MCTFTYKPTSGALFEPNDTENCCCQKILMSLLSYEYKQVILTIHLASQWFYSLSSIDFNQRNL